MRTVSAVQKTLASRFGIYTIQRERIITVSSFLSLLIDGYCILTTYLTSKCALECVTVVVWKPVFFSANLLC